MSFINIDKSNVPVELFEVPNFLEEPLDVYSDRYSVPNSKLNPTVLEDLHRHQTEIIRYMTGNSSLLVFGSGHSINCNTYSSMGNIREVVAMDFVKEASIGLKDEITFLHTNILKDDIPVTCDYALTVHTMEHFDREQVLNIVLPKLLASTKKALVVLVPYAENWSDEPSHKCRFYENDEFAYKASKYKIIRNNQEIVFWFEGEA